MTARPAALLLAAVAVIAVANVVYFGDMAKTANAQNPPPRNLAAHDYALSCAGCHGFDASGNRQVPSLRAIARYLALAGGREYLVRVPGVAQAPLSDLRLAALLNWLLAEQAGAAGTPPFSAAEVGGLRRQPLLDPLAARTRLTAQLEARASTTEP